MIGRQPEVRKLTRRRRFYGTHSSQEALPDMATVVTKGNSTESAALALVVAAVILLAFLVLYLVGFDQGAISRSGMYMHELMHDGRHLLGLPCH